MTRCFSAAAELLVNPHIALRFLCTFIKGPDIYIPPLTGRQEQHRIKQESLANAKVSARQAWYIGHYSRSGGTPSNMDVTYTSRKVL